MSIIAVAMSVAFITFLGLALAVGTDTELTFDRAILLPLRTPGQPTEAIGPDWIVKAATDVTALGGLTVRSLFAVIMAAYYLIVRQPRTALFVVVTIAGGAILGDLLKGAFDRPRPLVITHLVAVDSSSFPSGHAMNSMITYGALAGVLAKSEPRRSARLFVIASAIALTLLIGLTRIFLGVHWPSDVLAGWCIGGMWTIGCFLAAGLLNGRDDRKRALRTSRFSL